jgi:hypothetical protein
LIPLPFVSMNIVDPCCGHEVDVVVSELFSVAINPVPLELINHNLPLSPLLHRLVETITNGLERVKRNIADRCQRDEVLCCGITVSKG